VELHAPFGGGCVLGLSQGEFGTDVRYAGSPTAAASVAVVIPAAIKWAVGMNRRVFLFSSGGLMSELILRDDKWQTESLAELPGEPIGIAPCTSRESILVTVREPDDDLRRVTDLELGLGAGDGDSADVPPSKGRIISFEANLSGDLRNIEFVVGSE
jgi:hypothetical protein